MWRSWKRRRLVIVRSWVRVPPPARCGVSEFLGQTNPQRVVLSEQPVAAARLLFEEDHAVVRRVAVDPECQARGIGRSVMAWIHGDLRRQGHREVRLGVRKPLTAQRAFYERLGYEEVSDGEFWVGLRLRLAPHPV